MIEEYPRREARAWITYTAARLSLAIRLQRGLDSADDTASPLVALSGAERETTANGVLTRDFAVHHDDG